MANEQRKLTLEEKLGRLRNTYKENPISHHEQAIIVDRIQECFRPVVKDLVEEICAFMVALQRCNRDLDPLMAHAKEGEAHIITIKVLPADAESKSNGICA